MNLKKAKAIRKQLRQLGVDPSQRDYDVGGGYQEHKIGGQLILGGQITIAKASGRKLYKEMKHRVA